MAADRPNTLFYIGFALSTIFLVHNCDAQISSDWNCGQNGQNCPYISSERDRRIMEAWQESAHAEHQAPSAKPSDRYSMTGTGRFIVPQNTKAVDNEKRRVDLAAEDVPLAIFLKSIVFDIFETAYVLSPDLDASLSLSINEDLTLGEFVSLLNSALAEQRISLAIIDGVVVADGSRRNRGNDGSIKSIGIAPTEDGINNADALIYDVKHVPAETIVSILEPLFGNNTFRSSVRERGIVTLKGDEKSIKAAKNIIDALDIPFLSSAHFELVRLEHSESTAILKQVRQLFEQTGLLNVLDIPDANAILLVAKSTDTLKQAKNLISIIDAPAQANSRNASWYYKAQYAEASHLKEILDQHLGSRPVGSIVADPISGVITISGPIQLRQKLIDYLRLIDKPPQQVSIEVIVVEVTLIDDFRFGIQWDALINEFSSTSTSSVTGNVVTGFQGLSTAYLGTNLSAILNALESKTKIDVVTSPHILTYDRKTATINIGLEIPVLVQQATSVQDADAPIVNTTEYRETGVNLEVTPRIRGNQIVELDLKQEISSVTETGVLDGVSPSFSQRRVENSFLVPSGTTIAIGGLLDSSVSDNKVGVPVLGRIPGLGRAFRSDEKETRKTELVLLVRPTITDYYQSPPTSVLGISNEIHYKREAKKLQLIDQKLLETMIE